MIQILPHPRISIIIPTLNGAVEMPQLIEQISIQTIKVLEVIVIDSESTDNTPEIATEFGARVLNVKRNNFDHGKTRNLAAAEASGDIVIFMTQDAIPAGKNTFKHLIQPLAEQDIIVSYARQLPKDDAKITDRFLRLYNYPEQSLVKSKKDIQTMGIKAFQNSNVCAAYRMKEFKELGGFPTPVVSNEDMLFAAKAILAGYQIAYTATACVYHSHNYSYTNLFKRYFDIGASLDNAPIIKQKGQSEAKGIDFIINQLKFIIRERSHLSIPPVFLEAFFKYAGYKLGTRHGRIPKPLKKYLGLHTAYWQSNS